MATIIAASLQLQNQAEEAVKQLVLAGFAPDKVTSFFVNPPGQHALYPIGGDEFSDATEESGKNTAFVEITETLIGVMHHKKPSEHADSAEKSENVSASPAHTQRLRRAGMLVAVELADQTLQDKVVTLLSQLGATNIEKAEGEIINGEWHNFDPLMEPCYLSSQN